MLHALIHFLVHSLGLVAASNLYIQMQKRDADIV